MYRHTLKFNLNYFKDQKIPTGDLFLVLYTDSEAPISSFEYFYNIFKTNSYYGYPLIINELPVTFSQKQSLSISTNFIGYGTNSIVEIVLRGNNVHIDIPMTSDNPDNIGFSDIFSAKDVVEKLPDTWHNHTFILDNDSSNYSLSVWTPYNDFYTTTNNDAIYIDAVLSPFSKTVRTFENGEVIDVDDADLMGQEYDDELQKFNLLFWEGINYSYEFTDLSKPASTKEILDFDKEFPGIYTPTPEEIESSYKGYKNIIAYSVDGTTWVDGDIDVNGNANVNNYEGFTYSYLTGYINRLSGFNSEDNPVTYKVVYTQDNALYFVDADENIQLIKDIKENN